MKTSLVKSLLIAGIVAGFGASARAQSESFCANAADSSRIIRTGPVRAVAQAFGDLKVCLISSGFTDSAEVHPREWPNHSYSAAFETIRPGDARRLESNPQRAVLTINGQPRPTDSASAAWREQIYRIVELRWNIVSIREQHAGLENDIISTRRNFIAMTAEIDTLQRQSAALESTIGAIRASENAARTALAREERVESDLRSQLSTARSALASVQGGTSAAAQAQIRQAEQRVLQVERALIRQEQVTRNAERRLAEIDAGRRIGILTLTQRNLNADARIAMLHVRLGNLDADNRVQGLTAQIGSLRSAQRTAQMEAELEQAVARLREMLGR